VTTPLSCPNANSENLFKLFAYSMVFCGLEIHDLSIGMTIKQNTIKKLLVQKVNYIK